MEKVFKWEAAKLKENIAQERMNDEGENEKYKDYIVCGGGSVYESLLLHVDSVIVSTVKNVEAEGDLRFPIKTMKTYFKDTGIVSDNNDFTAIRYTKIDGGI